MMCSVLSLLPWTLWAWGQRSRPRSLQVRLLVGLRRGCERHQPCVPLPSALRTALATQSSCESLTTAPQGSGPSVAAAQEAARPRPLPKPHPSRQRLAPAPCPACAVLGPTSGPHGRLTTGCPPPHLRVRPRLLSALAGPPGEPVTPEPGWAAWHGSSTAHGLGFGTFRDTRPVAGTS